jgi:hypothetical protein
MAETTAIRGEAEMAVASARSPRVLVAENIGRSGVELLREYFEVDEGTGWDRDQLAERIGEYEGILIRSGTRVDEQLIAGAPRLRAIGRAGSGSTTSTSVPPPSAASSSSTRLNQTSSPPPSTPWPCCLRWRATSPAHTPR